jgi:hypothetical protein
MLEAVEIMIYSSSTSVFVFQAVGSDTGVKEIYYYTEFAQTNKLKKRDGEVMFVVR